MTHRQVRLTLRVNPSVKEASLPLTSNVERPLFLSTIGCSWPSVARCAWRFSTLGRNSAKDHQ
jgi:hypothetical protein